MDIAIEHGLNPYSVIVSTTIEKIVKEVLDRGFWAAFTIYPFTKMGNERMVEIVKQYGSERIIVNSAADWGISDPLAVPKTAALMKIHGIDVKDIDLVCFRNAITAFGQGQDKLLESDFEEVQNMDQSKKFEGNSVLRGGQAPRINKSSLIIS